MVAIPLTMAAIGAQDEPGDEVPGYAATVLADEPQLFWRLGEPADARTAADASGHGLDGRYRSTVPGVAGALTGDADTAVSFPGPPGDLVDVTAGRSPALDLGGDDFTVEAWIRTEAGAGDRAIATARHDAAMPGWDLAITNDAGREGTVRARVRSDAASVTAYGPRIPVDDGEWHHVAVAVDRDDGVTIRVDGTAAVTSEPSTGSLSNDAPLRLGDGRSLRHFEGDIDEFALYRAALPASRLLAHLEAGRLDARTVYTVAAAGDIACDPESRQYNGGAGTATACRQRATADVVRDIGPDAVLALGDLQYECGTYEELVASYDASWGRFKEITRPVAGNHEYGDHPECADADASGYFRYFGDAAGPSPDGWYSFDLGAWHIVALNSNCAAIGGCGVDSPQARWLRDDLAASDQQCTLALWHHPWRRTGRAPTDALWDALADSGVELLLTGHAHLYERFVPQDADGAAAPDGIRQIVVGTGGRNLHPLPDHVSRNSVVRQGDTFGVLRLDLHPTGYAWAFVPVAGGTFADAGSQACA